MTVGYWDRVVVLNGIVDYLLLLSAAWLSGLPLRRGWLLLWAAAGGAYAAAVFLPGAALLGHPLCRLAVSLAMALGAFRGSWRQAALFFLLAGGLAYTAGSVLYGLGKKRKWMHSVFHIFVDLGALLQFFAVLFYAV